MKFNTIVADPPWETTAGPPWASNGKSRKLAYPTMSVDEIKALPVKDIAEKNAHLYLWTINKYLEESYAVARAWGFTPSTMLVWTKKPHGIGLGGTFVLTTEFILFCRRGSLKANHRINTTSFNWRRGKHSQKPEAFYDLIMTLSPDPYVELFARRVRLGWQAWGNEILSDKIWGNSFTSE